MFERFTAEARDAVKAAVEVAQERRSPQVAVEHLIIGLAARGERVLTAAGITADSLIGQLADIEPDGRDAAALRDIGVDLDGLAAQVDQSFGPGTWASAGESQRARGLRGRLLGEHRPFTPDAKKCLELGLREALADKSREITATHLLRGVLRAPGDGAVALLGAQMIERLREDVGRAA